MYPIQSDIQEDGGYHSDDPCSWQGFNPRGIPSFCKNTAIRHPWKSYVNAYGHNKVSKTGLCVYHQKYCIDKDKRHTKNLARIMLPNKDGLCNECYVLKNGSPPPALFHSPGVHRDQTFIDCKKIDEIKAHPFLNS